YRIDVDDAGHRKNHHQRDDGDEAERRHLHSPVLAWIRRGGLETNGPERLGRTHAIGEESDQHADAGSAEPEVPTHFLTEIAGDERRDEGAQVDAHVENREASVAS